MRSMTRVPAPLPSDLRFLADGYQLVHDLGAGTCVLIGRGGTVPSTPETLADLREHGWVERVRFNETENTETFEITEHGKAATHAIDTAPEHPTIIPAGPALLFPAELHHDAPEQDQPSPGVLALTLAPRSLQLLARRMAVRDYLTDHDDSLAELVFLDGGARFHPVTPELRAALDGRLPNVTEHDDPNYVLALHGLPYPKGQDLAGPDALPLVVPRLRLTTLGVLWEAVTDDVVIFAQSAPVEAPLLRGYIRQARSVLRAIQAQGDAGEPLPPQG